MHHFKKFYTFYDAPEAFRFVTELLNSHGVENVNAQLDVHDGWCEVKVILSIDDTWESVDGEDEPHVNIWPKEIE